MRPGNSSESPPHAIPNGIASPSTTRIQFGRTRPRSNCDRPPSAIGPLDDGDASPLRLLPGGSGAPLPLVHRARVLHGFPFEAATSRSIGHGSTGSSRRERGSENGAVSRRPRVQGGREKWSKGEEAFDDSRRAFERCTYGSCIVGYCGTFLLSSLHLVHTRIRVGCREDRAILAGEPAGTQSPRGALLPMWLLGKRVTGQ